MVPLPTSISNAKGSLIDNANNLVFWCRFLNKLDPWHIVYIIQQ